MPKKLLPTNFQDDVLAQDMNGMRQYNDIRNSNGTVSLEDATTYAQRGSNFGAAQMNATNAAVNKNMSRILDSGDDSDITFSQSKAAMESATHLAAWNGGELRKIAMSTIKSMIGVATQTVNGLFSAADKKKLDGIASGAQKNTITGVKGNAESSYRTGNVNLTSGNIGALPSSYLIDNINDIKANTTSGKVAGALALKELESKYRVEIVEFPSKTLQPQEYGILQAGCAISGYTAIGATGFDIFEAEQISVHGAWVSFNSAALSVRNDGGRTITITGAVMGVLYSK